MTLYKKKSPAIDLVCAGFPKCGTSSIYYWLDAHPRLQGSRPKETFFFMDPHNPLAGRHDRLLPRDGWEYIDAFFPEQNSGRLRFECTTHNFYQKTARDFLTSLKPQPLILMLLREPGNRQLSSFRFNQNTLAHCNRSLSFNQYVECLLAEKTEHLAPYFDNECTLWVAKHELMFGQYAEWLDWWLERLSPDNLMIVLFEELCSQPGQVMARICKRLDIDGQFYQRYPFKGENKTPRISSQKLHRMILSIDPWFPKIAARDWLKNVYWRWQGYMAPEEKEFKEGLARLREYFAPWNRKLNDRYQLKLETWWPSQALGC